MTLKRIWSIDVITFKYFDWSVQTLIQKTVIVRLTKFLLHILLRSNSFCAELTSLNCQNLNLKLVYPSSSLNLEFPLEMYSFFYKTSFNFLPLKSCFPSIHYRLYKSLQSDEYLLRYFISPEAILIMQKKNFALYFARIQKISHPELSVNR